MARFGIACLLLLAASPGCAVEGVEEDALLDAGEDDYDLEEIAAITGCYFELAPPRHPWDDPSREIYLFVAGCRGPRWLHLSQYVQRWNGSRWEQVAAKDWGNKYVGYVPPPGVGEDGAPPYEVWLAMTTNCSRAGYFRHRLEARNPNTGATWAGHSDYTWFGCGS